MDQAFSKNNLIGLLNEDREKGGDLEERYIPAAFVIRVKLYKLNKLRSLSRYRLRTGAMTAAFYDMRMSRLNTIIDERKAQHAGLIDFELERISVIISSKEFRISVTLLLAMVAGKKLMGKRNNNPT